MGGNGGSGLRLTGVLIDYYAAVMERLELEVGSSARLGIGVDAEGGAAGPADGPVVQRLPGGAAGPARYRVSGEVVRIPGSLFVGWWILEVGAVSMVVSADDGVAAAAVTGSLNVLQGYEVDALDEANRARVERLWRVDAIVPLVAPPAQGQVRWARAQPVDRAVAGVGIAGYLLDLTLEE